MKDFSDFPDQKKGKLIVRRYLDPIGDLSFFFLLFLIASFLFPKDERMKILTKLFGIWNIQNED